MTEWKYEAQQVAEAKAQAAAQAADDARMAQVSLAFEKGIASLRASGKTTDTKVANEILQRVYTQCIVPESGVMLDDANTDLYNAAAGLAPTVRVAPAPAAKPAGPSNNGPVVSGSAGFDASVQRVRVEAEKSSRAKGESAPATK